MNKISVKKFKEFLRKDGIATIKEIKSFRLPDLKVIAEAYGWRI